MQMMAVGLPLGSELRRGYYIREEGKLKPKDPFIRIERL